MKKGSHPPRGLTRYIVTTLVNIGRKFVFTRNKSRYRPSAEALQSRTSFLRTDGGKQSRRGFHFRLLPPCDCE